MSYVEVERVFGRTPDEGVVSKFFEWFSENQGLEEAIDESNPFNGQILFDYQARTDSYIVEVQTFDKKFAQSVKGKFEELNMETKSIGDVKKHHMSEEEL